MRTWGWRDALRHPSVYFGISLVLLVWIGAYLLIATEQRANRAAVKLETENLARVFEENVIRSIGEIDTTIRFLRIAHEQDPARNAWPTLIRRVFGAGNFFVEAAIADTKGVLVATDRGMQPPAIISIADRVHFKVHNETSTDVLFISRPELSPTSGRWSIQLTRKLVDASGKHAGVIVVSLDPAYFSRFYHAVKLGKGGAVSLVGTDGIVRASGGQATDEFGSVIADSRLLEALWREEEGFLTLGHASTGSPRIASFRWCATIHSQ